MTSRDALQYMKPAQMTSPDKRRGYSFSTARGQNIEFGRNASIGSRIYQRRRKPRGTSRR